MNERTERVTIVMPCYNPREFLTDAVASARAQSCHVELIIVDDGSTDPRSIELLRSVATQADRFIQQANRGVSAARNAGIRDASGDFILPLDCDDLLEPTCGADCLEALRKHPDAAYVYPDYRVIGKARFVQRLPEFNFYSLLDQNAIPYVALFRRTDWELAGGYDERMVGYEDWDFYLRLGVLGRFGRRISRPLFCHRKHGASLVDVARAQHDGLMAHLHSKHADLYSPEGRAAIKARWNPVTCLIARTPVPAQTVLDCRTIEDAAALPDRCTAVVLVGPDADTHTAEYAALAIWSGRDRLVLPDGSVAVAPASLSQADSLHGGGESPGPDYQTPLRHSKSQARGFSLLNSLRQHLVNSDLLSADAWRRHRLGMVSRLIPLRVKELVNRTAGRPVFDLTFYLQFQTRSLILNEAVVTPLDYIPPPATRRRAVLVTPHLGVGGAESVALEIAGSLDRSQFEIFVIATQSREGSWESKWRDRADHVYDLLALCGAENVPGALLSILVNWKADVVLIQNSLAAYCVLPHLRSLLPEAFTIDLIHSVGDDFDLPTETIPVAEYLDLRVAISESGRQHLLRLGVPDSRIRLIRNGVDLQRFHPTPQRNRPSESTQHRILFAGRLDAVKRPLLLPRIARALCVRRPARDFRFVVAGDGPESVTLRSELLRANLENIFDLTGYVEDLPSLLAASNVVLIPSRNEGVPLIALEAMAASRPFVAANVGALPELVLNDNGLLIDRGPAEVEDFASALDALLSDAARRERMGQNGRKLAESAYDLRATRSAYAELFDAALKLRQSRIFRESSLNVRMAAGSRTGTAAP